MELLRVLTVFLVPVTFVSPESMSNGFVVPKVTLYRSLVGIICALWLIEMSLARQRAGGAIPRFVLAVAKRWLQGNPTRILVVAAWALLASDLISTLLSSSVPISLWGREPAQDGSNFYNTISHFVLFLVLATHLKTTGQLWRIFGSVITSGLLIGLYAALQFYELDLFGISLIGRRIVSSLGNPIFVGAFLLMLAPMTLSLTVGYPGTPNSPVRMILGTAGLTILILGTAYTQSRGPWVGLAVALFVFWLSIDGSRLARLIGDTGDVGGGDRSHLDNRHLCSVSFGGGEPVASRSIRGERRGFQPGFRIPERREVFSVSLRLSGKWGFLRHTV